MNEYQSYKCTCGKYESTKWFISCPVCGRSQELERAKTAVFGLAILIALLFGYFFPK